MIQFSIRSCISLCLAAITLLIVGCVQRIDTDSMIGMAVEDMEKKYELEDSLFWDTPNLPVGSESEKTYFLEGGNLVILFKSDGRIANASFESDENAPQERLNSVQQGWSKFVEGRQVP